MAVLSEDQSDRLAFIKHVLNAALDHARLADPFCSNAIVGLHDAVEVFVQMIAEHVGAAVSKKADFLEYWPAIRESLGAELPLQPAMKRLNQARVGLKHSGIRPTRDQIEELSSKTVTFFDDSSRLVFGVPFDALSSAGLVGYEPAASRLRRAEKLLAEGELPGAVLMCALAFDEIVKLFRSTQDEWTRSPFPQLDRVKHFHGTSLGYEWSKNNRELASHLEKIGAAFAELEPVLLMLALGVEYRSLARFRKITPDVNGMMDGSNTVDQADTVLNKRDVMFVIDFVTRAALRLREIDPNPPQAGTTHSFHSTPHFSVILPAHGTAPERPVNGALTEIGGGWEAWIFHGADLARVWRGDTRDAAIAYLETNTRPSEFKTEAGMLRPPPA
jgi:hypothetical protein